MKIVVPNTDKPHRCPKCHGIPDHFYQKNVGKAKWWRFYHCDRGCNVWWNKYWLSWRDN
jgi:hypothetical protein